MTMAASLQKILISNSKLVKNKPMPKKEALKKFNADFILKKYPSLKNLLLSKNIYYPRLTNAEFLAYDRAMWACHDKQWVND